MVAKEIVAGPKVLYSVAMCDGINEAKKFPCMEFEALAFFFFFSTAGVSVAAQTEQHAEDCCPHASTSSGMFNIVMIALLCVMIVLVLALVLIILRDRNPKRGS